MPEVENDKGMTQTEIVAEAIPLMLEGVVGGIGCYADTTLDNKSLENIPKFNAVCNYVWDKVLAANRCINSPYYSEQKVAKAVMNAAADMTTLLELEDGTFKCDLCPRGDRVKILLSNLLSITAFYHVEGFSDNLRILLEKSYSVVNTFMDTKEFGFNYNDVSEK